MGENELFVSGIGIARDVVSQVTVAAVEKLEGVARVEGASLAPNIISAIAGGPQGVESRVTDDKLDITIHVSVFFGYVFTQIAEEIRAAVRRAVSEQMGVECGVVNVYIDSLVFPKE